MAALSSKCINAAWWAGYLAVGLGLQLHFPGVDALVPGIILSCQEKRPQQTLWLCLAAILIQEGSGSLGFGNSLLWYALLLFFFFLGRLFFVTGSLFFIVLISMVLGVAHSALLYVTSSLQGITVDAHRLAEQLVAQGLLIPPLYALASLMRKRFHNYDYGI